MVERAVGNLADLLEKYQNPENREPTDQTGTRRKTTKKRQAHHNPAYQGDKAIGIGEVSKEISVERIGDRVDLNRAVLEEPGLRMAFACKERDETHHKPGRESEI